MISNLRQAAVLHLEKNLKIADFIRRFAHYPILSTLTCFSSQPWSNFRLLVCCGSCREKRGEEEGRARSHQNLCAQGIRLRNSFCCCSPPLWNVGVTGGRYCEDEPVIVCSYESRHLIEHLSFSLFFFFSLSFPLSKIVNITVSRGERRLSHEAVIPYCLWW